VIHQCPCLFPHWQRLSHRKAWRVLGGRINDQSAPRSHVRSGSKRTLRSSCAREKPDDEWAKHEAADGSNEEAADKSPGKNLRGGKKGSHSGSHGFMLLLWSVSRLILHGEGYSPLINQLHVKLTVSCEAGLRRLIAQLSSSTSNMTVSARGKERMVDAASLSRITGKTTIFRSRTKRQRRFRKTLNRSRNRSKKGALGVGGQPMAMRFTSAKVVNMSLDHRHFSFLVYF
jgi:hypothetical protein